MSRVEVVCRGTFVDAATGETIHAHDRRVCHAFEVSRVRGRGVVVMPGTQLLDGAEPLPDDFEALDTHEGTARWRLAINCPECGRGLTSARPAVAAHLVRTLAGHDVSEVDMESLRAYLMR